MTMSSLKRLLFIVDGMNAGGTQEFIYNFALHFPENPITIISLFGENVYRSRLRSQANVRVMHLCKARGTSRKLLVWFIPYIMIRFFMLRSYLIRNFDWADVRLPLSMTLWWLTGLYKIIPCYYNIDCDARQLTRYERLLFKLCLPKFPIVGMSLPIRGSFNFVNIDDKRLIDPPIFVTNRISISPITYNSRYTLLFIGRLVHQKDPITAIRLVHEMNLHEPNSTSLVIIGDGPLRQKCISYCTDNKIDSIRFIGFSDKIEDYMHSADGLVKTAQGEPANSVVREFLHLGKLVFSTIESYSDQSLNDRGLLFPICRDDLSASAFRLIEMLRNKPEARLIKERFKEIYDDDSVTNYYRNLINSRHPDCDNSNH